MTIQFAAPGGGGDGVKVPDLEGHLVICYPLSYEQDVKTAFKPDGTDAIRLNVADVDTGEFHEDALWFSGYIVGDLKRHLNTPVLARIGRGEAKNGQSPPWLLSNATGDADAVARAEAWLQANPGRLSGQALSSPAPSPAQPAPVAQPQPAPAQPVGQPAGSLI